MICILLQIICWGVSEGKVHLPYFLRTSTVLQRLSGCVTYLPIRQIAGLWEAKQEVQMLYVIVRKIFLGTFYPRLI